MSATSKAYSSLNIIDVRPLTASGQTRLAKVLVRLNSSPASGCILSIYRQKVVGIATRQDLLGALAQNSNWATMRLSEIVTRPVITIKHSEISEIASVLALLEQHQISYLPVVDEKAHLIGVIDQARLLRTLQDDCAHGNQTHSNQTHGNQTHRDQTYSHVPSHSRRAQIFADITLKIRQSLQLKEILKTTVDEIQRLLSADRVLIYQVLPDSTGKTISEAVVAPYPSLLDIPFPEEVFPEDYQTLYAKGRVRAVTDVHAPEAGISECLVEFIDQWQVKSKLIVPIVQSIAPSASGADAALPARQHLWGLLIAHQCSCPRQWSDFELDLMQQLAGQISLAIAQGQLMEYLEDRVKLRTAELTQANAALHKEIRERKQVGRALRQSEAQLRLITNNLPVLIAYVDRHQCYQFNNQRYEQWLGLSPVNMAGKSIDQVMDAAYYQSIRAHIERVLAGEQVTYESELTFQDGRDRSVSVTYIPHLETAKQLTHQPSSTKSPEKDLPLVKGFFALTTDISDRKAIERMKDEFIAVVSHEL
ncbi:MAG: GAF domain-containing protein, partial [Phormidesmis sp.]